MKRTTLTKSALQTVLTAAGAILFSLLGLSAIAQYDNKYITKAAPAQGQVYMIPEKGYCSLVNGWELYPDVLLTPDELFAEAPAHYTTWAGEYPNLALFHEDKIPTGSPPGGFVCGETEMFFSICRSLSAPHASM